MKLKIKEKQYDYWNELNNYANGTFDEDGSEIEKGIYGEVIYKLNALVEETSKGKFEIVSYELTILNGFLFEKLQEELISNNAFYR